MKATRTNFEENEDSAENTRKAILNVLEDFSGEKALLEDMQKAVLNILEDFSGEKALSEDTQKAVLNILEDFTNEKALSEDTQKAVLNILEDFAQEKALSEDTQKAVLNILEDFNIEKMKAEQVNQELAVTNKELEAFSYSVSHDLRAPLRSLDGYTKILIEDYSAKLDDEGIRIINIILNNTQKMGNLIDDLLAFSRLGRQDLIRVSLDMNIIVNAMVTELTSHKPGREIIIDVKPLFSAPGDSSMIKQVMVNLISNAIKYSGKKETSMIEIGSYEQDGSIVYYVKDNGAGFEMQYYNKLFGVFQRLHDSNDFEGTGVGLAIVQRIVARHNGKVWAEGKPDEGATFYFSLPAEKQLQPIKA